MTKTKEKHPLLLAVATVSLAAALAACDQAPAAGAPGAAPAPSPQPAAPAAEEPGLRTETLTVAIVADEDDASPAATPAGRAAATQTTTTANTTLSFPSDFGTPVKHDHNPLVTEYEFHKTVPAPITQTVIERGGVNAWTSINGGESWHVGGFDIGSQVKLRFEYQAGDSGNGPDAAGSVTITLAATGVTDPGVGGFEISSSVARRVVRSYLQDNPLLIRFVLFTDQ